MLSEVVPVLACVLGQGSATATAASVAQGGVLPEHAGALGLAAGGQPPDAGLALEHGAGLGGALDGDDVHGRLGAELLELILHHRVALHNRNG